jgi:hypothetical protein
MFLEYFISDSVLVCRDSASEHLHVLVGHSYCDTASDKITSSPAFAQFVAVTFASAAVPKNRVDKPDIPYMCPSSL